VPSLHQKVGLEIERALINAGISLPIARHSSDFFFIREIVLSSDLVTMRENGLID
jgi:hypothetical protein